MGGRWEGNHVRWQQQGDQSGPKESERNIHTDYEPIQAELEDIAESDAKEEPARELQENHLSAAAEHHAPILVIESNLQPAM